MEALETRKPPGALGATKKPDIHSIPSDSEVCNPFSRRHDLRCSSCGRFLKHQDVAGYSGRFSDRTGVIGERCFIRSLEVGP